MPNNAKQAAPIPFAQMLKFSVLLALIASGLAYVHDGTWSMLGSVGWWSVPISIAIAAALFVVMVVLVSHRWLRMASFYELTTQLHHMLKHLSWMQILVLSALAGIGEELLFRGLLQSWLSGTTGVYSAIVLSSLIFALLHAMTRYYFVFTLLLSLIFGALFHVSQSMLLLVLIHAIYDVIALAVIAKYPHLLGLNVEHEANIKL